MRIIQISDTHLSPGKPHFLANWPPLAAWIAGQRPDLVIHTGDVTVDGAEIEEDLAHAAELMRGLGVPFRAVPGNHDVGDAGHFHQPVDDRRLARWRAHFGPDRWVEDVEGFRLIGLDALLFGSGHPEEAAQMDWLASVMAEAPGRPAAWFLHRPLFIHSPSEGDTGYWSVKPQSRARLVDLVRRHTPALVASGHLHKAHQMLREGIPLRLGAGFSFSGRSGHATADAGAKAARRRSIRHRRNGAKGRDRRGARSGAILDRRRGRRGLPRSLAAH